MSTRRQSAKVYLVGAGPGAADLLTLRAARLLAQADVVLHDALVQPEVLALAKGAELISVGKRAGKQSTEQRFINKRLVDAALRARVVIRLKGGDPLFFGRASEELAALTAAGIAWEVVPGVTAASGAAASLGVSLTKRGIARRVTFATPAVGTGEVESDWTTRHDSETLVLYMAARDVARHAQALIGAGRVPTTPVVLVENATLINERRFHGTLAGFVKSAPVTTGPAILVVGEVVSGAAAVAQPAPSQPPSITQSQGIAVGRC
jgi:uroporphyrin-III C-methyltransferase